MQNASIDPVSLMIASSQFSCQILYNYFGILLSENCQTLRGLTQIGRKHSELG